MVLGHRLVRGCCCCCGGGRVAPDVARRLRDLDERRLQALAAGESTSEIDRQIRELVAPRSALAVGGLVAVSRAELLQAGPKEAVPVWVQSRCGVDRDCVPDDRAQPSYEAAVAGADAWLAKDPSRFVEIFDKPGGGLLAKLGPQGGYFVPVVSATRATAGRAVEEQRGQLSTYG